MYALFVNPVKSPLGNFAVQGIPIQETHKNLRKHKLQPFCEGAEVFESLQQKVRRMDIESIFEEDKLEDIGSIDCELHPAQILGEYDGKQIAYYRPAPREKEIVRIHERYHAIHHLALDPGIGSIWTNFADISLLYKELLAQLFTYRYCCEVANHILDDFLTLNSKQNFNYQTWKIFRHQSMSEAIELYWEIRRRTISGASLGWLGKLEAKLYQTIRDKGGTKLNNMERKKFHVWKLADYLHQKGKTISGQELAHSLNKNGFLTSYGSTFAGGRGVYKLISATYSWLHCDLGFPQEARNVARAFTKADGTYAYI